jgi:hypothetical protein
MAKQTINIGAAPNDGTGTPLRTSFDYCNLNFTELYTATGPSGNNIVVPGTATITGDLTVDTSTLKVDSTNNRVGIGTASPLYALDVRGTIAGGNGTIFGGVTFSSRTEIGALSNHDVGIIANSVTQYLISTGGNHTWFNGGSTAMTLNSTGLGVGTAPSYNIDVLGATLPTIAVRATSAGASNARIYLECAGTNSGHITYNRSLQALTLGATGGTTSQVTLDSAGNVGISVTPSAWTSSVRAIDIVSGGLGVFSGGITHNAYFDNTDARWEYKVNGSATYYNLQTGIHQWFVAASGTANNPITTFATAAMTLDASGNLIVNGTNSFAKISSYVTSSGTFQSAFGATNGSNSDFVVRVKTSVSDVYNSVGSLTFSTGGTGGTERVRIKDTGQVRFVPLASDPAGAEAGDVYYNSTSNKLKCYNGTTWNDLF